MESKEHKNKLIKNRLTDIVDNLVMDRWEGNFGEWENELKKYKLVAEGWSWGWGAQHGECS